MFSKGFSNDVYEPYGLLKIIKDERMIIEIGRSYMAMNKEENAEEILIDRLSGIANNQQLISKNSLARSVVDDFESGNIIQVRGWILSITEVRQCALYSIKYS